MVAENEKKKKRRRRTSSGHLLVHLSNVAGSPRTVDLAESLQKGMERLSQSRNSDDLEFRRRCTGAIECSELEIVKYTIYAKRRKPSLHSGKSEHEAEAEEEAVLDVIVFPYYELIRKMPSSSSSSSAVAMMCSSMPLLELILGVVFTLVQMVLALARTTFGRFCCYVGGHQHHHQQQTHHHQFRGVLFFMMIFYVAGILYWVALIHSLWEVACSDINTSDLVKNGTFGITIVLLVLSFLVPGKLARRLSESYDNVIFTIRAHSFWDNNNTLRYIQRELKGLLQQANKEWGDYSAVSLSGFCAGAIIALDAVYPFQEDVDATTAPAIVLSNLVTVACPFDFVRTLFPNYFNNNRIIDAENELEWANVFIPTDAMGTNFHYENDDEGLYIMDVNGNYHQCSREKDQQPPPDSVANMGNDDGMIRGSPTTNIAYRRGLLNKYSSASSFFDELQLALGSLVGYLMYVHLLYMEFTDDLCLVFNDEVAALVIQALHISFPTSIHQPRADTIPETANTTNTATNDSHDEDYDIHIPAEVA